MLTDVSKKKAVMMGLGVIFLALLAFVGLKLYQGVSLFSKAEADLDSALKEVSRYYARDPFPSMDNINVEAANVTTLEDWYATLTEELQKGEVGPAKGMSPSKFKEHLGEKRELLARLAEENRVILAEKEEFSVGFEKYFAKGSEMPLPSNVPRLTQQLTILEKLCTTLIEERVSEISKIQREVFEISPAAAGASSVTASTIDSGAGSGSRIRRRSTDSTMSDTSEMLNAKTGLIEEGMLFASMRFRLSFKAPETVLVNVLNRLAKDTMFAVVSSITIKKDGEDVFLPKSHEEEEEDKKRQGQTSVATGSPRRLKSTDVTEDGPDKQKEDEAPKDKISEKKFSRKLQLVSGPKFEKPMNVILEVDVYRFKGVKPE